MKKRLCFCRRIGKEPWFFEERSANVLVKDSMILPGYCSSVELSERTFCAEMAVKAEWPGGKDSRIGMESCGIKSYA